MDQIKGIFFRPFAPGDEDSYLGLYNDIHPVNMTASFWHWYNAENPAGPSVIETAWDADKLVGVYGLSPRRLSAGGVSIYGAFSDIALTRHDYRYRGIFSALGKRLYRRAEREGIKIIYGFPTEHNRHGLEANLGWGRINEYRLLAGWGRAGSALKGEPREIQKVCSVEEEFDRLWDKISDGPLKSGIMAARDGRFLDWRFLKRPGSKHHIYIVRGSTGPGGYAVIREIVENGETYVNIEDIMAVDINSLRHLINHILAHPGREKPVRVRLPAGSIFYYGLLGMGFRESGPRYYFGHRLPGGRPEYRREWYYTMADASNPS